MKIDRPGFGLAQVPGISMWQAVYDIWSKNDFMEYDFWSNMTFGHITHNFFYYFFQLGGNHFYHVSAKNFPLITFILRLSLTMTPE